MKTLLLALTLLTVVSGRDRFLDRQLLGLATCSNFNGPVVQHPDLEIEISYLGAQPTERQVLKYPELLDNPIGPLFGEAVVHLSNQLEVEPLMEYFIVDGPEGGVIGLEVSDDACDITLDFIVLTSCHDSCIPTGVCLEINTTRVDEELGLNLPYRKGCAGITQQNRPRCIHASVMALGMGSEPDEEAESGKIAYTNSAEAALMIIFETPFYDFIDLKPSDFECTGPDGTEVISVEAAIPGNAANIAYTIKVKNGPVYEEADPVEICFVGVETIQETGTPFDAADTVCTSYLMTKKEEYKKESSVEILEATPPPPFC